MELVPVERWMDPKTPPPYPQSRQFSDIVRSFCNNFRRLAEEEDFFETHICEYQKLLCNMTSTRRLLKEAPLYKSKQTNMSNNFCSYFFSKQPGSSLSPERCLEDYNACMRSEIKKDKTKCYGKRKHKQTGKKKKGKRRR